MLICLITFSISGLSPWPPSWTIKGTWKVPYTNLSNPITIVQEPGRQYTNKFDGVEIIWKTGPAERFYRKIVGNGSSPICYGYDQTLEWDIPFVDFLPDPTGFVQSDGNWTYHGRRCQLWTKNISNAKGFYYRLYIDELTGDPLCYWAQSISIYDSHYDVYILEIDEFSRTTLPGIYDLIPSICDGADSNPDPYPGDKLGLVFHSSNQPRKGKGKFSHLDSKKWLKMIKGRKRSASTSQCISWSGTGKDLPDEFSWRNYSYDILGKPRDQVACGSCWAFATAEVLESAFANITKNYSQISVNQIMDCTWDTDNYGCQGGDVAPSLVSLMNQNASIAYEKDYPYLGVSGMCGKSFDEIAGKIDSCYQNRKKNR